MKNNSQFKVLETNDYFILFPGTITFGQNYFMIPGYINNFIPKKSKKK